ncbi:hypothetical protein AGR4B_Lc60455 [Agrobacterium tumefaciens str. CFBP 5621]|nr:hypothetical protein AGR4B_Lc60455 [Agrobacterium tumefaciens str. CFBP 5621]
MCRVSAPALQPDIEEIRSCQNGARRNLQVIGRGMGGIVQPVNLVNGKILEQPVGNHGACAAQPFLGRLENEHHRTGKIPGFRQIAGGAEQDGGVHIMPAAVELSGIDGRIGQTGFLRHRQGIHIGPQPDGAVACMPAAQHTDHTGLAITAMDLDAPGSELFGDDAGRAHLLETDFGMLVQIVADGDKFGNIGPDPIKDFRSGRFDGIDGDIHGISSGQKSIVFAIGRLRRIGFGYGKSGLERRQSLRPAFFIKGRMRSAK